MSALRPVGVVLLGDHMVGLRSRFANELNALGINVCVAAPTGTAVKGLSSEIQVMPYPMNAKHLLAAATAVVDIRSATGSGVVHAFSTLPATIGSIAAQRDRDGAYVRTVNGLGRSFSTPGISGLVLRTGYTAAMIALDRRIRWSVFQNRDDDAWYARTPILRSRRHSVILGSGVDLDNYDPANVSAARIAAAAEFLGTDGRPTALLVGRRLKTKGIDDLKAAAEIASHRTRAPLLFTAVGPEEPNPRIGSRASDAVFGSVEFRTRPGWDDMPALYAASTAVVLPTTYREGIPRVLLEAAAFSKPLIAYDVPGCREIVVDGTNGLLVTPGDLAGLASGLLGVLEDQARHQAFATASRRIAEATFDVRLIARQYADLYRSL